MNTDQKFYQSIALLAFATGLLLIPLVAMQFTNEVAWAPGDFLFAGTLIFGTGLTYKLITRKSVEIAYRVAVGLALAAAFLLVWVNGAVGRVFVFNAFFVMLFAASGLLFRYAAREKTESELQ